MSHEALRAQLYAIRTQVDAAIALLEATMPLPAQEPPSCRHLHTEDAGTTLTTVRIRCVDCGTEIQREK